MTFAQLNIRDSPVSYCTDGDDKFPNPHSPEKMSAAVSPQAHSLLNLKTFYVPKRYVFVVLGFFGTFFSFAMRVNLSVAIVAMVNQTTLFKENISSNQTSIECPYLSAESNSTDNSKFTDERYDWSPETQGNILGSYYYGYVITNLPGGFLAEKLGAKWVFGGGIILTTLFCLLTPIAASWGVIAFTLVRALQGLSDGVTLPSINMALSIWAPQSERSVLSSIVFMGVSLGTVFAMIVSGYLCSTDTFGGWSSTFYAFGIASSLWFILWCFFVFETPFLHPTISEEELNLYDENKEKSKQKNSFPWRSVCTSIPAWALLLAHVGNNFGFLILLAEVPTYLTTVLHFDLASNGLLSALPFIAQAVMIIIASFVADGLRQSNKITITTIRKLLNSIGLFGPAACLFAISLCGCRTEFIITLLCLGMGLNGCIFSGFNCTHIDMCPEKSATLFGITNTVSNLSGIIGPIVVSVFVTDGATVANWSKVFYTAIVVYIITGGFFAMFASAELQPWSSEKKDLETEEEKPSEEDKKTYL